MKIDLKCVEISLGRATLMQGEGKPFPAKLRIPEEGFEVGVEYIVTIEKASAAKPEPEAGPVSRKRGK